jgi:4-amino-4-deoxy-L-arabinose transferase-like glycosyltransferase
MSTRNRARKRRAVTLAAVAAPPPAATRPAKQARPKPEPHRAAPVAPGVPFERGSLIAAGGAALVAFVTYALTVQPSTPSGDSGELITAAYTHGISHPPGYPLYMIIGYAVSHLPGASPALWMNLLSALFDAIAVGVVFLVSYRLVASHRDAARRWTPYVAASVGALLLAFSSLFWSYSVVAEVFALNNLFAAVLLLIGIEWCRRPQRIRLLWLFMLVFGLALCNQQTIALFVPAFVVLAWQGWVLLPRTAGPLRISLRDLGIAVVALAVGLLPYLYLPIAASTNPLMDWGHPTTVNRFVCQVTRCDYGSASLVVGGKPGSIWENLRMLATSLTHGFVSVGILLAVAGLWWAWRSRRAEGIALFVAFLFAGPVFQAYTRTSYPDDLTKGVVARFYILPSVPLAILAGLGAWWVLRQAERVSVSRRGLVTALAAAALLVVPVASAADHYSSQDQSRNYVTEDYGKDVLGELKPHALLIMRGDENLTTMVYSQFVQHLRPDVVAVDSELLKRASYVAQIRREHPQILIPFTHYDGGVHTSLNALIQTNLENRPVYTVGSQTEKNFGKPFSNLELGLVMQWVRKGSVATEYAAFQADPQRYTRLHWPTGHYAADSWEKGAIAQDYGLAAFNLAYALDVAGRKDPALIERLYRLAIQLYPAQDAAYKNLGLFLYDRGGDPEEVIKLWTTFLKLNPNDKQAASIRTVLAKLEALHR